MTTSYQIKTTEELENLTKAKIPKNQKTQLQKIIKKYPVKFTNHLLKLIKKSPAIAKQFIPDIRELEEYGTIAPFEEGLQASRIYGLERLYTDRAIITISFACPAYCRFCFRKSRVLRGKPSMTYDDINKAVKFIKKQTDIRGILITGGDPFLCNDKLIYLIKKLSKIDHLFLIRIGTRSFLYQPENLTERIAKTLSRFIRPNIQHPFKSKTLSIVTHFNHPDEISSQTTKALHRFTSKGIILRNQTVLLKGINDNFPILRKLFEILVGNNVVPYYLFHCMPLKGAAHLRTSVQKGVNILKEVSKLSGLISPHYIVVTQVGKVRLIHSSKLKYKIKDGQKYVTLKTPYTVKKFLRNTKHKKLPENCYSDKNGFITVDYLDGGDYSVFK